jgi:hypothetical protein
MTENKLFADGFYSEREDLVKKYFGSKLDELRDQLKQLYSPCMTRLMKAGQQIGTGAGLTITEISNLDPSKRQIVVSATLYYDAFWRLESAYLMLRIGLINVAYSSLRSCLENVIAAHIVENIESESLTFLKGDKINQSAIAHFVSAKDNENIKQTKDKLGKWGVHSCVESIGIGIICNPNAFEKMMSETNDQNIQTLNQEFGDYAHVCYQAINTVFLIFMLFVNKGTQNSTVKSKN